MRFLTTRPAAFLHLTDLHLGDPASDPGLRADTVSAMRALRPVIEDLAPRLDFIAISGDLVNGGDRASYRVLREIVEGAPVPVLYALGNHDSRPAFRAEMLGGAGAPEAPYDHESVIAGLHVVTLDSSVPGRIGGALEEGQFDFLDAALSRHADLPKLLMIHHPPALGDDPAEEWESLTIADSARLGDMIEGRGVIGILSGHIHTDRVTLWRGAPLVVSTGHHCIIDPLAEPGVVRLVSGAGFALCEVRDGALGVTFARHPADQRELARLSAADLRAFDDRARGR